MKHMLYQLGYHVYFFYNAKKLKVNQLELLENYFKMPSSNEIDNCAVVVIAIMTEAKPYFLVGVLVVEGCDKNGLRGKLLTNCLGKEREPQPLL